MELLGQIGARRVDPLPGVEQFAVQVGEDDLGAQDILLAGLTGLVADAGHLDEVLDQRPVVEQDALGAFVVGQVIIGPLDGLDDIKLGRAKLGEGDLRVLLGGQPAQGQGAEPGELLGDQQVPGQEAGRRLEAVVAAGVIRARDDRIIQGGDLRNPILQCQHVVAGRLDDPVLRQSVTDVGIDRMGPGKFRRRRLRPDRGGHRGGMPAGTTSAGALKRLCHRNVLGQRGHLAQPATFRIKGATAPRKPCRFMTILNGCEPSIAQCPRDRQNRNAEPAPSIGHGRGATLAETRRSSEDSQTAIRKRHFM